MSYVTVWIHCVWSTKNRQPLLTKEIRADLFRHIFDNGRSKDIWVDTVNGYTDHIHCLISLDKDQTISKIMQLLKGKSTHWLNKNRTDNEKINWQDDYFAVSVGQSQVEKIRKYIHGQEEHHRKKTFAEEVQEFMIKYGWQKIKDNG
jgi:putative transposase